MTHTIENKGIKTRKKIFVLLSRVPYPLEKGDKLRAFHQIRQMSKHFDIILVTLSDEQIDPQARTVLSQYVVDHYVFRLGRLGILIRLFLNLFSERPFQVAYFYNKNLHRDILDIIDTHKPDYYFCQLIRTAEYLKDLKGNKTLDYQDVFSRGLYRRWQLAPWYRKPLLKMEYRRVARYEEMIFDHYQKKTIISYPDRDLIPHKERERIEVIPNGVDFEYFRPTAMEKRFDIIFSGNMAYPPNINGAKYLVREVMPLVWKELPDANVVLAGASPALSVKALQSDRVLVTGWVDDLRLYYNSARLFVAPMQIGTGLQNKVLEAMAMKLPCITSPLANDALDAPEGDAVLVGKDPKSFASHIVSLLSNNEQRELISANGYHFVQEHYQWSKVCDRLAELIGGEVTHNN